MKYGTFSDYEYLIGEFVYKRRSRKPFKSGSKEEMVVKLTVHDKTGEIAAEFSDGSICEAHKLEVALAT